MKEDFSDVASLSRDCNVYRYIQKSIHENGEKSFKNK